MSDERVLEPPAAAEAVEDLPGGPLEGETAEAEEFEVRATPGGVRGAIEALLMVVDEPVTVQELAAALPAPVAEVVQTLHALEAEYAADARGFALREFAGGWRVYSRAEYAPVVERFLLEGQHAKLTQASLETLAVIAYKQPVSRSRVSAVRGVNVDGVVRTLLARGLITEVGHDERTNAALYGTTDYFLQRMGMGGLDELPALAPYLPDLTDIEDLEEHA